MTETYKYAQDQLAAIVWLTDSAVRVRNGEITLEEAASDAWAIDAGKASRVTVLVAVDDTDEVVYAGRVVGVDNESAVPPGKTRRINRSRFTLAKDTALEYLKGPSPWPRRRNPQTTFELRDLPGADALLSDAQPPTHGAVHLGGYSLIVRQDGAAELRMPKGQALTVRAEN